MKKRTHTDLVDFLARAGSKGWLNPGTASALKSVVNRLGDVMEDSEKMDVSTIDQRDLVRRFGNLNPDVSPGSLKTYLARLKKAIELFVSYTENPMSWQPPASSGAKRAKKKNDESSGEGIKSSSKSHREGHTTHTGNRGFTYPFPLRDNCTIMFSNLPRDLKTAEVERISAFLRSLAEDFSP